MASGVRAVALLEGREDRLAPLGRDPGTGVGDREAELSGGSHVGTQLDGDANPAALGELDGVAGEVQKHLPQTHRVGVHDSRRRSADRGGDLQPLALRARRHQLDHALDEVTQVDRRHGQVQSTGIHSGEIEDLIDQRDQGLARTVNRLDITRVLRAEGGAPQQLRHPENAAQGRADLMPHGGEKARFGDVRRLGAVALGDRLLEPPDFVTERLVLDGRLARLLLGATPRLRKRRRERGQQAEGGARLDAERLRREPRADVHPRPRRTGTLRLSRRG